MADKIAVDMGGTSIRVAIVRGRRIKAKITIATEAGRGFSISFSNLMETVKSLWRPSVKAICIGAPAPMDIEKGIIISPRNLPTWNDIHLRERIERKFRVPCHVNNDANCFALGEALFGAGKKYHSVVGIIIGTGLGMGIVVNKDILNGNSSAAGEIGEIKYKNKTFEDYCSSHFFKEDPEFLIRQAEIGNNSARREFESFGKHIASMLATVINTVDPEIIVIGGGLSRAFPWFKKSMLKELKGLIYPLSYKKLRITQSELPDAALLGASELR